MSKKTENEPEIILTDAERTEDSSPGETIENLDELKQKAALADELRDKNLRLVADMDNLRKRIAQEKIESVKYANESILESLIPVLDNFELALQSIDQTDNLPAIKDGIKMVFSQLKQNLKQEGLDEISALGQSFDHNLHDAISQEVSDEHPEGTVLRENRKGYLLKGKLLRPASVVVSKPSTRE